MTRDMVLGLEVVLADGTVLPSMNNRIKSFTSPRNWSVSGL